MKIKVFLVTTLIIALYSCDRTQKTKIMTQKQVTIREKQVDINYVQEGNGKTTLCENDLCCHTSIC